MVNGSVTISIEDFQSLLDAKVKAEEIRDSARLAAKELQVFLSYICDKENISEYIEEFNRQSKTASISIENGRAKIIFKDV
tara:strand:+ start:166 stop:408 length:243 start_codon:yes stop_codon:yes gene_type:complete